MMNLLFLKYFCDAAENESVVRAAKLNHITPSAVSVSIRKLGEYFGKDLLSHGKNRFELTSYGRDLFMRGRILLASSRRLEEDVMGISSDFTGRLEFGIYIPLAQSLLPKIARSFRAAYSEILLRPRFGDREQLRKWIEEDALEFCISMSQQGLEGFDSLQLLAGEYRYFNFSRSKDTARVPLVLMNDAGENSELQKSFSKFFNSDPLIELISPTWEGAYEYAKANKLCAILPDFVGFGVGLKNAPPLKYSLRAFFRREPTLSSKSQLFLEQTLQFLNSGKRP